MRISLDSSQLQKTDNPEVRHLNEVQTAFERAESAHELRERRLDRRPLAHVLVQRREHLTHI